ncbi:MAG: ABC transporter permease subunit [Hyphomicrobiales bacterium]
MPGLSRGARRLAQLAPMTLLLAAFFLAPLLRAVFGSIGGLALDFHGYAGIAADPLYADVLARTFRVAATVTIISVAAGYPVAYLLTAVSRRSAAILGVCIVVPLFTAYLIRTYAWVVVLGRNGVLNKMLLSLGLIEAPLKILGTGVAVAIGMIHVLMPVAIFTMYASMARLDRSLVAAAQVLGANPLRAFTRVYLPMSLPGVISAALLVFIIATGFYITPVLLGGPADTMIAQLIVLKVTTSLDLPFGYSLALILLLVTLGAIALASLFVPIDQIWAPQRSEVEPRRLMRRKAALYRPVSALFARIGRVVGDALGRVVWLIPALLRAYAALAVAFLVAPLVIVYILSFSSSLYIVFPPPGFSLQWYEKFFTSADWRGALSMSLRLAVVVASLSTIIGGFAAFALVRSDFPGKRVLFLLMMAPLLVPAVVMSLLLYVSMADIGLLGTFGGLVLGHLVLATPYAVIVLTGAVRGLDRNLEDAASVLGAPPSRTLRTIVLPLLAPALLTAWIMAFLTSFDEFLVTLFLLGRQTQTLPLKMWSEIRIQLDPVISAASSSIITVVALIVIGAELRRHATHRVPGQPA